MAQVVTILRDFPLSDNTVVEWAHTSYTEYVVARGIHIKEREHTSARKLYAGEVVTCYWDSGTYCTTKEGAMRIGIKREQESLEYLAETYAK